MSIAPSNFQTFVPTDQLAESIDVDTFKAAFRMHPAGVAVITTESDGRPAAMTVSSLASVSTDPPLVVFSLSRMSGPTAAFLKSDNVVIHLPGAAQLWLAKMGAAPGVDRFADPSQWTYLPTGEPVFPDTYAWLRGRIASRQEAGNSVICVAHIVQASVPDAETLVNDSSAPLVYHGRTWHQLGADSTI
ncbi:flavin oxidoreductase (plasmid) [Arthrobacter sp. NicSoilE8]|nr:flavin oxidoreductase [Arthrobacter sp. NicSoilE8]